MLNGKCIGRQGGLREGHVGHRIAHFRGLHNHLTAPGLWPNRSSVQLSIGSQLVHCCLAIPRHKSPNPYKMYSSYTLASSSQSSVYTHLTQVQIVYTHLWKVRTCLWWKRSSLYLVTPMAVLTTGLPGSCKHTDEVCQHLRALPVTWPPGREVTHLLLSHCAKLGELRLHILVATTQFLTQLGDPAGQYLQCH